VKSDLNGKVLPHQSKREKKNKGMFFGRILNPWKNIFSVLPHLNSPFFSIHYYHPELLLMKYHLAIGSDILSLRPV